MENNLPKPPTTNGLPVPPSFPKPETALPLPELEIPAHANHGYTVKPSHPHHGFKWLKWLLLFFVITTFILIAALYMLLSNAVIMNNKQSQEQSSTVVTPSAAPEPTVSTIDTSTWQTYTNPQLNFYMKYPADIIAVSENPQTVTFMRKEEAHPPRNSYTISIFIATRKGPTPEDGVKSETCGGCTVTTEKAQINNAVGLKTTSGFDSDENYYLINNLGKGSVLRLYLSPNNNYPDYGIFKKMLSTFQFTNPTSTQSGSMVYPSGPPLEGRG